MHQEAGNDQEQAGVLWVPHKGIETVCDDVSARTVHLPPAPGKQDITCHHQHQAGAHHQCPGQVRTTEDHNPQVPEFVIERLQDGIGITQPAGQQINGQRKAVHLAEQRHQKRCDHTQVTPFCTPLRRQKAQKEKQEQADVKRRDHPHAVGIFLCHG